MTERKRHRPYLALLAATLVFSLLPVGLSLGGGSDGDAGGGRTDDGVRELKRVKAALNRAEDHASNADAKFRDALREAHTRTRVFVTVAFGDYSYFEGCNAADLVNSTDEIDSAVERGYYQEGEAREGSLGRALEIARFLDDSLEACAARSGEAAIEMQRTLRRLIAKHGNTKNRDAEGQRSYEGMRLDILGLNRQLIADAPDQVKGGCHVPTFQEHVTTLGRDTVLGEMITADDLLIFVERKTDKARQEAQEDARRIRLNVSGDEGVKNILRDWKKCSTPLCADNKDNDGDGSIDASDLGCQTGIGTHDSDDLSEEDAVHHTRILCDLDRASTGPRTYRDISVNSGDELVSFSLRNLTSGELLFAKGVETDPDFAAGGPLSLGAGVCGPGTAATVSWRVEGTAMTWDYTVTKDEGVTPQPQQIVAAGSTR